MGTIRERQEATMKLHEVLSPGDTIFTVLRHVSPSGLTRWISPFIVRDGTPEDISWLAAVVLEASVSSRYGGVKMEGVGIDMGFALVYNLSSQLFPDGFAVEGRGRNGDMSGWDHDGGYALRREWM